MKKLNIGSGNDYRDGYINIDISDRVRVDKVVDIEQGFPFDEDTFDEILCHNVLCQILHPRNFVNVMNELWYITKPEGRVIIRVPNAKDVCAYQDPMDCRRFTPETFSYLDSNHRRYNQYGKHYGFLPFKVDLVEDNGRQMVFHLSPVKPYDLPADIFSCPKCNKASTFLKDKCPDCGVALVKSGTTS